MWFFYFIFMVNGLVGLILAMTINHSDSLPALDLSLIDAIPKAKSEEVLRLSREKITIEEAIQENYGPFEGIDRHYSLKASIKGIACAKRGRHMEVYSTR